MQVGRCRSGRGARRGGAQPRRDGGDCGAATAEFAVVVPAVVLLLALTVGSLAAAGRQVRLEQGVAQAARLAARGESDQRVAAIVETIADGSVVDVSAVGGLVCVSATAPLRLVLPLPGLTDLRARSCALEGGR